MHVIKYLYALGLFQEIQNQERILPWRTVLGLGKSMKHLCYRYEGVLNAEVLQSWGCCSSIPPGPIITSWAYTLGRYVHARSTRIYHLYTCIHIQTHIHRALMRTPAAPEASFCSPLWLSMMIFQWVHSYTEVYSVCPVVVHWPQSSSCWQVDAWESRATGWLQV